MNHISNLIIKSKFFEIFRDFSGVNLSKTCMDDDEKGSTDEEIRGSVVNDCLSSLGNSRNDLNWTIATWLPTLQNVVGAALSVFFGSQEESSLDLIKDMPSKESGSMSVFHDSREESSLDLIKDMPSKESGYMSVPTFSTIQTVKYILKSKWIRHLLSILSAFQPTTHLFQEILLKTCRGHLRCMRPSWIAEAENWTLRRLV